MAHQSSTPEAVKWAVDVGQKFVAYHRSYDWGESTPFPIDECWIGSDLALYIRYSPVGLRLGKRVADLDIDVTGHEPAQDAAMQAMYIFHDLYGPPPAQWIDSRGYRWVGGPPRTGSWEYAVEHQERIVTLIPEDPS